MKTVILFLMVFVQLNSWAQISTNPGGGPNGSIEVTTACPHVDPAVYVFESFFIRDMQVRYPSITERNLFSLLESISIVDSLNTIQVPGQLGRPRIVCTNDDKESLKIIYDMYKAAMASDKECAKYLKFTKKLEIIEKTIQSDEKK